MGQRSGHSGYHRRTTLRHLMTFQQTAFIALQYLLPQHVLSRLVGWLAASEIRWLKNSCINFVSDQYEVNMAEAQRKSADEFRCFNDFCTRELEDGARPLASGDGVV